MASHDEILAELRKSIEQTFGHRVRTPKDFDSLAEAIFEKTHQHISPTTLKRFWGYMPQSRQMRYSTLDLLTAYLGYSSWEDWCNRPSSSLPTVASLPSCSDSATAREEGEELRTGLSKQYEESPSSDLTGSCGIGATGERSDDGKAGGGSARKRSFWFWLLPLLGCLAVVAGIWLFSRQRKSAPESERLYLKSGMVFNSPQDYLPLFGISPSEQFWDEPLPHHPQIIVWSPEYRHPVWHNDGNADSLMPTITEYWLPDNAPDPEMTWMLAKEKNKDLLFMVERTNELRITFMKNLTDSGYVFLGIYRTNLTASDSSHVVWERIADECDLNDLGYLEQLRH